MYGGMAIMLYKQGIGKRVIQTIFKDKPNIKHIILYTTDDAIGFWKKLGGEVLGEKDGIYYMRINRNSWHYKLIYCSTIRKIKYFNFING